MKAAVTAKPKKPVIVAPGRPRQAIPTGKKAPSKETSQTELKKPTEQNPNHDKNIIELRNELMLTRRVNTVPIPKLISLQEHLTVYVPSCLEEKKYDEARKAILLCESVVNEINNCTKEAETLLSSGNQLFSQTLNSNQISQSFNTNQFSHTKSSLSDPLLVSFDNETSMKEREIAFKQQMKFEDFESDWNEKMRYYAFNHSQKLGDMKEKEIKLRKAGDIENADDLEIQIIELEENENLENQNKFLSEYETAKTKLLSRFDDEILQFRQQRHILRIKAQKRLGGLTTGPIPKPIAPRVNKTDILNRKKLTQSLEIKKCHQITEKSKTVQKARAESVVSRKATRIPCKHSQIETLSEQEANPSDSKVFETESDYNLKSHFKNINQTQTDNSTLLIPNSNINHLANQTIKPITNHKATHSDKHMKKNIKSNINRKVKNNEKKNEENVMGEGLSEGNDRFRESVKVGPGKRINEIGEDSKSKHVSESLISNPSTTCNNISETIPSTIGNPADIDGDIAFPDVDSPVENNVENVNENEIYLQKDDDDTTNNEKVKQIIETIHADKDNENTYDIKTKEEANSNQKKRRNKVSENNESKTEPNNEKDEKNGEKTDIQSNKNNERENDELKNNSNLFYEQKDKEKETKENENQEIKNHQNSIKQKVDDAEEETENEDIVVKERFKIIDQFPEENENAEEKESADEKDEQENCNSNNSQNEDEKVRRAEEENEKDHEVLSSNRNLDPLRDFSFSSSSDCDLEKDQEFLSVGSSKELLVYCKSTLNIERFSLENVENKNSSDLFATDNDYFGEKIEEEEEFFEDHREEENKSENDTIFEKHLYIHEEEEDIPLLPLEEDEENHENMEMSNESSDTGSDEGNVVVIFQNH